MKSTTGENYMAPNMVMAQDFIDSQANYSGYSKKTKDTLNRVRSDKRKVDMLRHAANRLSGGGVIADTQEEQDDVEFLNRLHPQKLCASDNASYLDFATYALYRKEQEEQKGNGDPKQNADKINEEIKKIREELNAEEQEGEQEGDGENDSDVPGPAGKGASKKKGKDRPDLEDLIRIYDTKLNDITWLVSRVMTDFIPEVGVNISNLIENVDGEERLFRQMNDMSEVSQVNSVELGMPDEIFLERASSLDYYIPVRASGIEQKQFIYVSIDGSGSMHAECNVPAFSNFRRENVTREICLHLVERVKKGICEIYLRVFEEMPWELLHAYDEASAIKMEEFLKKRYRGNGGTSINEALKQAIKDLGKISFEKSTIPPEILIITDGDDQISVQEIPEPYRLNYISVESYKNDALYKLCKNFIEL